MRVISNIKIPIYELLNSMSVIYSETEKQTLINQPIILNETPIGVVTKISEDGKYGEGCLWLDIKVECEYDSISTVAHPIVKRFQGIYIDNDGVGKNTVKFKNGYINRIN